MTKARRKQLAKAELLMNLATLADSHRSSLLHEPGCGTRPPGEWPDDDVEVTIARTYGLSFGDLAKLWDQLGAELETRAIRAGYEQRLDAA